MFRVGETCSHSVHVFLILRTPNSENFGETCSESEKCVPTKNTFFETPNSELQTPKISEKRVLSQRNVFWVGETCFHSEHVFPKLRTPNSKNYGETCSESEKRVLGRRNVFPLRTRFSETPNFELRKFRRNVF